MWERDVSGAGNSVEVWFDSWNSVPYRNIANSVSQVENQSRNMFANKRQIKYKFEVTMGLIVIYYIDIVCKQNDILILILNVWITEWRKRNIFTKFTLPILLYAKLFPYYSRNGHRKFRIISFLRF